ncbi:hypothetical protein WG926_25050 [Tistrella sp. BH-R2-4]|uniref:Polysaccharide biosynthesis protein n=1 Tax=Tistrella arctica TaxID=3133430 RepID=A0ABU9YS09_9PROT
MSLARTVFIIGGTLSQRVGNVFLLPVMVATMSAADFTRFGLFTSAVAVAVPLLTQNLHMSVGRMYFDYATPEDRAAAFLSTLVVALFGIVAGGAAIIAVLQAIGVQDPLTFGRLDFRLLLIACAFFLVVMQAGAIFSRVKDRNILFAAASTISGFGLLLGYVILEPFFADKVLALVYSYIVAQGLAFLCTTPIYGEAIRAGRLRPYYIGPAFAYASGTTIYVISTWVIAQAGRWVGGFTLPEAAAAGFTLISYGMVVLSVLINAYAETRRIPFLNAFVAGNLSDALAIMLRVTRRNLFGIVGCYAVGVVIIYYKDMLLPVDYELQMRWLLPALLYSVGAVFFNLAFWLFGALKETWWLAVVSVLAAASYAGLLFWLPMIDVSTLLWCSAIVMAVQAVVLLVLVRWRIRQRLAGLRSEKVL